MVPPGGFHYFQGDVRLSADTIEGLYKKVEDYRAENGVPNMSTRDDVNWYICGQWPEFCHQLEEVSPSVAKLASGPVELLADIQVWSKNLVSSVRPHPLVGDELAEARAQICAKCPFNINWKSGCGSCIVAADRLCASIRQARDTQSSPTLGGCKVLRHDNRAAIFLQKEDLARSSDIPSYCWLNK
jgi:hypothetical protein